MLEREKRQSNRARELAVVGMPSDPISVPAVSLVAGEIRIVASAVGTRRDLDELLVLAAQGAVRCRVERLGLEQANAALERVKNGEVTGRLVLAPEG